MNDVPEIYYWMGKPISEIPREELERLFIEAHKKINDLDGLNLQTRTEHIRDLVNMRRRYGR